VAVKLEDLKQAVADGQSQLRTEVAALRQSFDGFRSDVPTLVANQVSTQLTTYATAHAMLHAQLETERQKDVQRFWAVVGILSTIIAIVVGIVSARLYGLNPADAVTTGAFTGATVAAVLAGLKSKIAGVLVAPFVHVAARLHK